MSDELIIDCFGHPNATSLDVESEGKKLRFLFEDKKPAKLNGHIGLFVDYTATAGRDYLRYPKSRRVALLCEPNASIPFINKPRLGARFTLILTYDARLLERGAPYVETPFGTSFVESVLTTPQSFPKTKLVSMIGAPHPDPKAGHILRNQVIDALAERNDVDRFGKGIRWIDSKLDGLQEYAFSIAMENCDRDFYFSEKIIDCFATDTVPIYYGFPGVARYFNPRGIIVFHTVPELLSILDSLSWKRYQEMIPYTRENCETAIRSRWATRRHLFERVADQILASVKKPGTPAPVPVFRRFQDAWRGFNSK
jgi:hypothetical protein